MQTIHLVVNPTAGRGKALAVAAKARSLIERRGIEVVEVVPERPDLVRAAVAGSGVRVERLVAVGGDGLVHRIIDVAVEFSVPLGLIAGGSGNDFLRGVNLDLGGADAVDAALADPQPVDLIRVGDKLVASVVTIGLPVRVNRRANSMRFPRSSLKYSVATLVELKDMTPVPLEITADGRIRERPASIVALANTSYFGGGMEVCPAAVADDGMLDLMVVAEIGPLEMARFLPRVFRGGHVNHRAVTMERVSVVSMRIPDGVEVWGDGEPVTAGSCDVRVEPEALSLCGYRGG